MARGVSQDRVNDAADALLQRGERPTIDRVRATLGTGSPNTLMRMLEVWWAGLASRLAAQARADLPGIPEPIQRAMMTLWSEATATTRQEAETRLVEREHRLEERETEIESQLSAAKASQVHEQGVLSRIRHQMEQAETTLVAERAQSAGLQASLADAIRSFHDASATVESLRKTAEKEREQMRADLDRAASNERRWLLEVDRAREEAKQSAHETKTGRAELAKERERSLCIINQHVTTVRNLQRDLKSLQKESKKSAAKVKQAPRSRGAKKERSRPQKAATVRRSG